MLNPTSTDPDDDALTYTAAVTLNATRATVSVTGSVVTVTGVLAGLSQVTVTATDPGGLSVEQGFFVTVSAAVVVTVPLAAESATDPVSGTAALTFTDAVPVTTMDTDSVWQLAVQSITSLPAPTGGTGTEEHTPTSWSRTALSPTDTLAVWRSQRTRTFTDGAFISATVWGTPVKVSDRLTVLADAIIPDGHQLVGAGSLLTAPSSVVPDAFMVLYIAGDTVLDGDDPPTLGDATLAIQRALYTTNNQWRINEDGAGDFLALYEAGGTYEDRLFHVQPSLDTVISLPASSIDTGASNTDRLRWNLTAAEQLQFQQLEQDGRFILFITEPESTAVVTIPLAASSPRPQRSDCRAVAGPVTVTAGCFLGHGCGRKQRSTDVH